MPNVNGSKVSKCKIEFLLTRNQSPRNVFCFSLSTRSNNPIWSPQRETKTVFLPPLGRHGGGFPPHTHHQIFLLRNLAHHHLSITDSNCLYKTRIAVILKNLLAKCFSFCYASSDSPSYAGVVDRYHGSKGNPTTVIA